MKSITHSIRLLGLLLIAFCLSLGMQYLYAWTGPTEDPPEGNVEPPVNVSATNQIKDGGLGVGSLAVYGESAFLGSLDMGGYEIVNLGTPTASSSAATKAYVDSVATGGGGSSAGDGVMYLRSLSSATPASCPSGWTSADYKLEYAGGGWQSDAPKNNVRTCYATTGSCRVMYLSAQSNTSNPPAPASCPSGWTEADYREIYAGGGGTNSTYVNDVRTCYVCE